MKNIVKFAIVISVLLGVTGVAGAKGIILKAPIVQQSDASVTGGQVEAETLKELRELNTRLVRLKKSNATGLERIDALSKIQRALPKDLIGKSSIEALIAAAISAPAGKIDAALEALKAAFDGRISALEGRVTELERRAGENDTKNSQQDGRLDNLEDGTANLMFLRVSIVGGLTMGDGNDGFGNLGSGVSKALGDGIVDIEGSIGGSGRADGLLIGSRGDYLFGLGDIVHLGPGLAASLNYGDNHAEIGPELSAEFGSVKYFGIVRLNVPYVVADPDGHTGWSNPNIQLGGGLRF